MSRSSKRRLVPIFIAMLLLGGVIAFAYVAYRLAFSPAVTVRATSSFYIPTGHTEVQVLDDLVSKRFIDKPRILALIFKQKGYARNLVVPGKYTLEQGMSLVQLTNHLRAGNGEVEVKITFNNMRNLADLAGKVARNIEADSLSLITVFLNPEIQEKYGFESSTFISMFLPDTYNVEWDTDADEFLERMAKEYRDFWTEDRKLHAQKLSLSPGEVTTLASIVQAEQQNIADERPVIAALYLNRLRIGMRLQSDPTVVYAVGDFKINRVLSKHLIVDSPYNTYIYAGLPPGPINIPSKKSIDAVLYPDTNTYIYMCAKADFSGRHAFATNLDDHNRNAAAFRKELNKREIFN